MSSVALVFTGRSRSSAADDLELGELWPFLIAGAIAPGLSQILFVRAVREAGAARTSVLMGTAPLVAVAIALTVLDEPVRAPLLAGPGRSSPAGSRWRTSASGPRTSGGSAFFRRRGDGALRGARQRAARDRQGHERRPARRLSRLAARRRGDRRPLPRGHARGAWSRGYGAPARAFCRPVSSSASRMRRSSRPTTAAASAWSRRSSRPSRSGESLFAVLLLRRSELVGRSSAGGSRADRGRRRPHRCVAITRPWAG